MNKEKAEKETRYVTVDSREEKDEVKPRKDLAIDNEYETKTQGEHVIIHYPFSINCP